MNFGNLKVCDTLNNIDEYIYYTVDGVSSSILNTSGNRLSATITTNFTTIEGRDSITLDYFQLRIAGTSLGTFGTANLSGSSITGINYPVSSANVSCTFTNYGSTSGSYIEGIFNGNLIDNSSQTQTVSGRFRIRQP